MVQIAGIDVKNSKFKVAILSHRKINIEIALLPSRFPAKPIISFPTNRASASRGTKIPSTNLFSVTSL